MATQLCQCLTVALSLVMHVVAFLGARSKLDACLVTTAGGSKLLDIFALTTFLGPPVVLGKLFLLFLDAYLLSLGLLVWAGGKAETKAEFVDDVMAAKYEGSKKYRQTSPSRRFTTCSPAGSSSRPFSALPSPAAGR
eukprot:2810399-Prymnesium_polylepis.1